MFKVIFIVMGLMCWYIILILINYGVVYVDYDL